MTINEWKDTLRGESFSHVYVQRDTPHVFYPDHQHENVTAHIILEGEMAITVDGKTKTFKVGERFDVPAGTIHAAKMGLNGCTYLIGEK